MSSITTYSKLRFDPIEPDPEFIKIEDIAHSLSLLCRANGHFKRFFSVAQHSLNCCREAKARGYSEKIQLACLLHDASEAYLSDITRPVKHHLPEYLRIEERLQNAIWNRFILQPLTEEDLHQVFEIDDAQLYHEFLFFMEEKVFDKQPSLLAQPDFESRPFDETEKEFLTAFLRLTRQEKEYCCVGIDGCKGKWIAVALHTDSFEVGKYDTIDEICEKYEDADAMLIDIPIGLPENIRQDEERPDKLLRMHLKGKASSVFSVPCRQAVYEEDKEQAKALNHSVLGRSLSEQSLGIRASIRQVDCFLQQHPAWKNRLAESHPEYCFAVFNNGKPILESKMEEKGVKERFRVLSKYFPESPSVAENYLSAVPSRKKIDDVIDALCLAVMGKSGLEYGFAFLPETPKEDSRGLKMQIVTAKLV